MHWSFGVMELSVFALSAVLFRHAKREGNQWLSTYVCGILFGTSLELLLVSRAGASYEYGEFWLMVGFSQKVPLWVGVGWGAILYAASWTAQRLALPRWLRPLAAGLLAVATSAGRKPVRRAVRQLPRLVRDRRYLQLLRARRVHAREA
jgi:hypothetical protein